jgi:hypothetical protein
MVCGRAAAGGAAAERIVVGVGRCAVRIGVRARKEDELHRRKRMARASARAGESGGMKRGL